MARAAPPENHIQGADEREASSAPVRRAQEAPSLLIFSGGRFAIRNENELSEMLTRKFREYFP